MKDTDKNECDCQSDFSDEMCAFCFAGSNECVDQSCTDQCCEVKQCKCSEYDDQVCSKCKEGDSGCPDEECAAVCCDYAYNQEGESYTEKDSEETDKEKLSIAEQSVSGSVQVGDTSAALSYAVVAVVLGSAIAVVATGLRVSICLCSSMQLDQ